MRQNKRIKRKSITKLTSSISSSGIVTTTKTRVDNKETEQKVEMTKEDIEKIEIQRKKAIRKKNSLSKEKHRAYGIMNQFSKEYAEGVTNNDLVVQSTLKEAEQWRRTIAEQEQREEREEREQEDYEEHEEQEQYPYHQQHHQLSPLSDSSDLGTSLLEYESRRLARLAPKCAFFRP